MLPDYDPNDSEAGMKLLEELTANALQIQQQVLKEILSRNAKTEYLGGFLKGQFDEENFKKNVPVVNYDDIKPYIERIANGEPSEIISAQPITELLTRFKILFVLLVFLSRILDWSIIEFIFLAALELQEGSRR